MFMSRNGMLADCLNLMKSLKEVATSKTGIREQRSSYYGEIHSPEFTLMTERGKVSLRIEIE